MGKQLRQQRRGRGSPRYRVPSHRYVNVQYPKEIKNGKIIDIIHALGKRSPVALVDFSGEKRFMIAAKGMYTGQIITNEIDTGNILELGKIPDGTKIYNIEIKPGDGGKLCRSSGTFATLITHDKNRCIILLPSKKKKILPANCRATIGVVASSGRIEKPFMKAGTKFYKMRAFGKLYPRTSGVSMNPVNHPFGGQTKPGKPKTVSRHMPPGKKVGSISPKRVGKKIGKKILG
ncbi:MAG: 50S ribosomal protein L2 [Candidatus Aenigmatarchaeota archaeon]